MTVMLLQRFASPHSTHSQKSNDAVASSAHSASPPATSLSTPSPTPVPFLFLLESQESWDTEIPAVSAEPCASPFASCPASSTADDAYPSRLYASFTVPASAPSLIINNALAATTTKNPSGDNIAESYNNRARARSGSATNAVFNTINDINNANNINKINNYNNNNNNVVILSELGQYERGRKIGGQYQTDRSEVEGWIVGGESVGLGVCSVAGGARDNCSGVVGGGALGGGVGGGGGGGGGGANANPAAAVAGAGFYGRFATTTAAAGSTTSAGTADSRTAGGAAAVVAAGSTASTAAAGQPQRIDGGHGVAMRYYRLWIYACNVVLLGSAVGFAAAVSRTLVFSGDPRRNLAPGVPRALDPTALYAYLALATQLGLVQLLGCIAARRLSARLLNAYWVLLLALLFGDAVIGVAWVFRFERMRAELRPSLRLRLKHEYGRDARFSEQWDRLQRDFACCGVAGHEDFEASAYGRLPPTCCPPPPLPVAAAAAAALPSLPQEQDQQQQQQQRHQQQQQQQQHLLLTSVIVNGNNGSDVCQHPYPRGCEDSLVDWLRKTADLLFVLGFCVIAFAKLCFLGILRYEIREMIQKIRLLREPPPPPPSAILGGSNSVLCASPPFVQSFSQLGVSPVVDSILTNANVAHINNNNNNNSSSNNNNNSSGAAGAGAGARRTTLPMAALPSGNSSLLQQSDDYSGVRHPLLSSALHDGGADSDTNSHCALILEETTPPSISAHSGCTASTRPDKSNGNNNYEMREFNRRLLISNGGGPGGMAAGPRNRRT